MKDWFDTRIAICLVLSLLVHFGLAQGLERLPAREPFKPPQRVEVRVIEPAPPPPPEEPKPEEPKPEEPKPVPHEIPKAQPFHAPTVATVPKDTPAPDQPAFQQNTDEPVYGVNMSSTSTVGTGPPVPVGNTLAPAAAQGSAAPHHAAPAPISAAEATKLPLPQGRCVGKYTDEAKVAGVEGTVVLDLIVGEDGKVRDISVMQGLPNGLTDAALKAIKACQFSPGERDGKPVPVKIRGFKIRFVLAEAQ